MVKAVTAPVIHPFPRLSSLASFVEAVDVAAAAVDEAVGAIISRENEAELAL